MKCWPQLFHWQQTRSIDYLVIDKQAMQADVEVTEQEVADYY